MAQPPAQLRSRGRPDRSSLPSVLVVLVSGEGAEWLRQCLISLSKQTYGRIGVLAIDNASKDESGELLESTLGPDRVMRLRRQVAFAVAVAEALDSAAVRSADYVLLLHDDTVLAPEAVGNLVEAARGIEGDCIVGPKVLDATRPDILRDVGLSADRFGYQYSPLEEGEIDQGQYDRVREVLAVSSCAMLATRDMFARVGLLDERLDPQYADIDFGWRARIAGVRVLMTPRAVALHGVSGDREGEAGSRVAVQGRYERERAALASTLKNYSLVSLAWLLPLWIGQSLGRTLILVLSRRFEEAYEMAAAAWWNVRHLAGTWSRRRRIQRARTQRDHRVDQFMAPADVRVRRWAQAASGLLGTESAEAEGAPREPALVRAARLAAAHPVFVAWTLATLLAAVAYRHLASASPLQGGALAVFPSSPSGFFAELVSGLRSTGLGGSQAASPALGFLGIGSVVAFASPAQLQKILLLVLPAIAAISLFRAAKGLTRETGSSVVAAGCYALSAVVLWAVSEGRIPELVFIAGLPWLAVKIWGGFTKPATVRSRRWIVGGATGMAVISSFFPGTLLALLVLVSAAALVPPTEASRRSGVARAGAMVLGACVLLFPVVLGLVTARGRGLASITVPVPFGQVLRLSPGAAPGAWVMAFYLPVAAALCLVLVAGPSRRAATRAGVTAVAAVYLGWAAAAGWLPIWLSNPTAYIGVAALCYSLLVGLGFASIASAVSRAAFGYRQLGGATLALVVGVGLVSQAAQAGRGAWAVGQSVVPAAYSLVGQTAGPPFRVLFVGRPHDQALVAPGGENQGTVEAGRSTIRYAVTGPAGASAFDFGRAPAGPGFDELGRVLGAVLSGSTSNGGALLAPFGIRYIVALPRDLPAPVARTFASQVDLDRIPAGGLAIFQDAVTVGTAVVGGPSWTRAAGTGSSLGAAMVLPAEAGPIPGGGQRYRGESAPAGSIVLLSGEFDGWWRLSGGRKGPAPSPEKAFGWAVGFPTPAGLGAFEVHYDGQWIRTLEILALAFLWGLAAWVTRRPAHG